MRRPCTSRSRLLGSTSTASGRSTSTACLEVSAGALSAHTATTTRSTATREASASELFRAWAALFNLELNTVNSVRVGSDSGLVRSGCLEVDESAVL
jgi:hypothetical protein